MRTLFHHRPRFRISHVRNETRARDSAAAFLRARTRRLPHNFLIAYRRTSPMCPDPSFSVVRRHCRGILVGSISLHLYALFMLGAMFQLTTGAGICGRNTVSVELVTIVRRFLYRKFRFIIHTLNGKRRFV